jgi:thioredoxin 1
VTTPLSSTEEALELIAAHDGALLLEFGAAWCPPCRTIEPALESIAADLAPSLTVRTVDVDRLPELVRRFDVRSAPTLLLFRDGEARMRLVGARPERALREAIAEHV